MPRVAVGAEDGRAVVVYHLGGHSDKNNAHISDRLVKAFIYRTHEGEKRLAGKKAEGSNQHSENTADTYRGLHRVVSIVKPS